MQLKNRKKIALYCLLGIVPVVCFLAYAISSTRETNAYKILYLQEYCLGLQTSNVAITDIRQRLGDSMIESQESFGVTTFMTSRVPFSPTCRIEYEEATGKLIKATFVRD